MGGGGGGGGGGVEGEVAEVKKRFTPSIIESDLPSLARLRLETLWRPPESSPPSPPPNPPLTPPLQTVHLAPPPPPPTVHLPPFPFPSIRATQHANTEFF